MANPQTKLRVCLRQTTVFFHLLVPWFVTSQKFVFVIKHRSPSLFSQLRPQANGARLLNAAIILPSFARLTNFTRDRCFTVYPGMTWACRCGCPRHAEVSFSQFAIKPGRNLVAVGMQAATVSRDWCRHSLLCCQHICVHGTATLFFSLVSVF